eukprot:Gb_22546 [translate_table: standard]
MNKMPSPALKFRCSPAHNECKLKEDARHHRRGLSLESMPQDRDEDLALFQDMRTTERNNFLHPSTDDIDESLSIKLGGFSDVRMSGSTPTKRESRDLLNTNVDNKNDYNWLLTPPGTPLFPSLDEDTSFINLSQRGTMQSRVIATPRTSRAESSSNMARRSASPRRSSPASGSSGTNSYSRGRVSPTPSTSGSPKLRPLTPSGRPSTPMSKPSVASAKSSAPMLRRSSTISSGYASSVGRSGISPGKSRRGGSSSPKIQAWQSNIPGFSSDPPPNLRTTLSDHSTSHLRRFSPASRHGGETGNRSRRQSVSPTISRSASSSNSHDRDQVSSHSKGSVISSCEDEMGSIQSSFPINKRTYIQNIEHHHVARKQEPCPNTRFQSVSKRQARPSSTNVSGGCEPATRQMDLRRNSKSMFRPLLSSAPATSFYTHKTNVLQHQTSSINSSVTTSSNASSEQGACVAPDTEGSDGDAEDIRNEPGKSLIPLFGEENLVFDKMEVKCEDAEILSTDCGRLQPCDSNCLEPEKISGDEDLYINSHEDCYGCKIGKSSLKHPDNCNNEKVLLDSDVSVKSPPHAIGNDDCDCSQNVAMGYREHSDHGTDEDRVIYFDSARKEVVLNNNNESVGSHFVDIQEDVPLNSISIKNICDETSENLQAVLPRNLEIENMQKHDYWSKKDVIMNEGPEKQVKNPGSIQIPSSVDCQSMCLQDCSYDQSAVGTAGQYSSEDLIKANQVNNIYNENEGFTHCQGRDDIQHHTASVDFLSENMPSNVSIESKVEHSPGCVASVKLPSKVNMVEQEVPHAEAVNAINLQREYSHLRGSRNDLKNSAIYDANASTLGTGSIKQTGTRDLCQTSSRKKHLENITSDSSMNVSVDVFIPTAQKQNDTCQTAVNNENDSKKASIDYCLDIFEITSQVKFETPEHTAAASNGVLDGQLCGDLGNHGEGSTCVPLDFTTSLQENHQVTEMDWKLKDAFAVETCKQGGKLCNDVSMLDEKDHRSACIDSSQLHEKLRYSHFEQAGYNVVKEAKKLPVVSLEKEKQGTSNSVLLKEKTDCFIQTSSVSVLLNEDTAACRRKADGLHESEINCQTGAVHPTSDQMALETVKGPSALAISEGCNYNQNDAEPKAYVSEGDSSVKTDAPRGYLSRSLTLAEATDTVLFCSSIVHSLVHNAMTIGMQKENLMPIVDHSAAVKILGIPAAACRSATAGATSRHILTKPKKIKSRKTMPQMQIPSNKIENDVKAQDPVMHVVTVPQRDDIARARKANSKCRCIVM